MKLLGRCLMLVSVVALAGTAACSAPAPPKVEAAAAPKAHVFSATSSALSRSTLGITRWHSTIERGTNGAVTIDGQDGAGHVKFLTTARIDKRTSTLHINAVFPQRGELVWDIKHQAVLSNTLPVSAAPYVKGIFDDFPLAHPRGGEQAFSIASGALQIGVGVVNAVGGVFLASVGYSVGLSGAIAVPVIGGIPGAFVVVVGKQIAQEGVKEIIAGVTEVIKSATEPASTPAAAPAPATPGADPAAPGADPATPGADPATPAADPATPGADPATPGADPAATPGADPATPGADPATPGADPAATQDADPATPAEQPSADPAPADQTLPDNNNGGDLDTQSGDSGGGAEPSGGGDPGGGEFAVGICRRVAVSKTTGVRACTHY